MKDSTLTPILRRLKTYGYKIINTKKGMKIVKTETKKAEDRQALDAKSSKEKPRYTPKKCIDPSVRDLHDLFDMMIQRSMINPHTDMAWDSKHIIEIGKTVNALIEILDMLPTEFKKEFRPYSRKMMSSIKKKRYPYMKYRDIVLKMNKLK